MRNFPRQSGSLLASVWVATVLAILTSTPALAGEPVGQEEQADVSVLTARTRAVLDAKLALASSIAAAEPISSRGKPIMGTTPQFVCPTVECDGPGIPEKVVLNAFARQQSTCWYCGPASGQVLINYSWNVFNAAPGGASTTTNKVKQSVIADAMDTTTAGTNASKVASGLNDLAKRPSGFAYFSTDNGGSPSSLYSKLITDVWEYDMGMIMLVRPHEAGAAHWLSSWPNAIHAGHYIAVHGYDGYYTTSSPRHAKAYYADSSGGCSGSTGIFRDPIVDLYSVNEDHSGIVVW